MPTELLATDMLATGVGPPARASMPAHRASAYPRISPGPGPRQSPQERTHHRPDPTASSRRGRLPRGAVRSCRRARGGRARARRPSRGTSSWRSGPTPVTRQRIPESTDGRCVGWSAAGCKGGRALKAGCLLCGNRFLDRPRVKAPAPTQVLPSSLRRASRGRRSARARSRVRSTAQALRPRLPTVVEIPERVRRGRPGARGDQRRDGRQAIGEQLEEPRVHEVRRLLDSVRRLSGPPFDSRPAPRRLAAAPQSATADQGASRLPTSGVSAGTPSVNSSLNSRFTNPGAPTM